MIVYNMLGANYLLIGGAIGGLLYALLGYALEIKGVTPVTVLVGALVATILDLRFRRHGEEGPVLRWLLPRQGGHFCFIPLWLIGATTTLAATACLLGLA